MRASALISTKVLDMRYRIHFLFADKDVNHMYNLYFDKSCELTLQTDANPLSLSGMNGCPKTGNLIEEHI
jgi:hypothetical protein